MQKLGRLILRYKKIMIWSIGDTVDDNFADYLAMRFSFVINNWISTFS